MYEFEVSSPESDNEDNLFELFQQLAKVFSATHQEQIENAKFARSCSKSYSVPKGDPMNEECILKEVANKIENRSNNQAETAKDKENFLRYYNKLKALVDLKGSDKKTINNAMYFLLELMDTKPDSPSQMSVSSFDLSSEATKLNSGSVESDDTKSVYSSSDDYEFYQSSMQNFNKRVQCFAKQKDTTSTKKKNCRPSAGGILRGTDDASFAPISMASNIYGDDVIDDLVENVIYSFIGAQGDYLIKDPATGIFKLNRDKSLSAVHAGMLVRLSELGYYHDRLIKFANEDSGLGAVGFMGQALADELNRELNHFYGAVAALQDKYNAGINAIGERQTLLSLLSWYSLPLERLQWINKIATDCKMKKGGELLSFIGHYLKHGNPLVSELAQKLLTATCKPLLLMLKNWLFYGEIKDNYNEFFVEEFPEVGPDRLWYDKYRLRLSLLPKFIPIDLANKILNTGKSINFLRHVCNDSVELAGREELLKCIKTNPEHFFANVPDTKLHLAIDAVYLHTAKRVLNTMVGPHKLAEHLQSMRRFLLLGKGDFVGFLMANMKVELDKPAQDMYAHDLSAIVDAAVRCSNAQSEDSEILNHLDVRVNPLYGGELGWDVVSLQYTVRGPLATMLEPSMPTYQKIFKPLWRIKRMEFLLSTNIWKEQKFNGKVLRPMAKDLARVSYLLNSFTSETMHFINQVQYYILFEVIECAWVELEKRLLEANALDDILNAHNEFLKIIMRGLFLEPSSVEIANNLGNVFESILVLEKWQEKFFEMCMDELNKRKEYERIKEGSRKSNQFSITNERKFERDQEHKIFEQSVAAYQKSLETLRTQYEKNVRDFLLALNSNGDLNLQLFGIRLDFNEYYKKRDQSINVPLTFEHIRMSNVFGNHNKAMLGSRYSSMA